MKKQFLDSLSDENSSWKHGGRKRDGESNAFGNMKFINCNLFFVNKLHIKIITNQNSKNKIKWKLLYHSLTTIPQAEKFHDKSYDSNNICV